MDEFRFRYVVYGELGDIAAAHPAVYDSFSSDNGEITEFGPFAGNPDAYEDFPLFFYIEHDNRIVCNRFAIPDILFTEKGRFKWAWGGGFFTDPDFRGRGLGTKLIKGMIETLHERDIGTGMVFSTPVSIHIYKKLGYNFPGYADRYIFLKSFAPFLRKHIRFEGIVKLVDLISRPFPKILYLIRSGPGKTSRVALECVHIPSEEVASRLEGFKLRHSSRFRFNDSAEKLEFKLSRAGNSMFYLLSDRESGRPEGYFILKNRLINTPLGGYSGFKLMSLMDYGFYGDESARLKDLISIVFEIFFQSDADALDAVAPRDPLNALVRKRGMFRIGKGMSFTFTVPSSWDLHPDADLLGSWQLSHFSGDGYSFE